MAWLVDIHPEFEAEFPNMHVEVRKELFAKVKFLEKYGPLLGRPHAGTLAGSKHSNMKELRFNAVQGVWRVAFAFDTARQAILLVAGDKSGTSEKRFYKKLIEKADARFDAHLANLEQNHAK